MRGMCGACWQFVVLPLVQVDLKTSLLLVGPPCRRVILRQSELVIQPQRQMHDAGWTYSDCWYPPNPSRNHGGSGAHSPLSAHTRSSQKFSPTRAGVMAALFPHDAARWDQPGARQTPWALHSRRKTGLVMLGKGSMAARVEWGATSLQHGQVYHARADAARIPGDDSQGVGPLGLAIARSARPLTRRQHTAT